MTDQRSQVDCFGLPPVRTWADYRRGCLGTYRGGHHDPESVAAFQHGMETVFNLLEREFPPAELCKAAPAMLAELRRQHDWLKRARFPIYQDIANIIHQATGGSEPSEPVVRKEDRTDDFEFPSLC
jgi:hypothetical protein